MAVYGQRASDELTIVRVTDKIAAPRQAPAFTDAIAEAEENVRTLRARIEALADKLCGSVPENDASGGETPPLGIFGTVAEHGRSINRNVGSAREALDRIERCLP